MQLQHGRGLEQRGENVYPTSLILSPPFFRNSLSWDGAYAVLGNSLSIPPCLQQVVFGENSTFNGLHFLQIEIMSAPPVDPLLARIATHFGNWEANGYIVDVSDVTSYDSDCQKLGLSGGRHYICFSTCKRYCTSGQYAKIPNTILELKGETGINTVTSVRGLSTRLEVIYGLGAMGKKGEEATIKKVKRLDSLIRHE